MNFLVSQIRRSHLSLLLWLAIPLALAKRSQQRDGEQSLLQTQATSRKIDTIIQQLAGPEAHTVQSIATADDDNLWPFPESSDPAESQLNLSSMAQRARSLKFYMPLHGKTCDNTTFPTTSAVPESSTKRLLPTEMWPILASGSPTSLSAVGDWLWVVGVDSNDHYIQHRLACSGSLVSSAQEADLCYPSCNPDSSPWHEPDVWHTDVWHNDVWHRALRLFQDEIGASRWIEQFNFEVPENKRASWSTCRKIIIRPEATVENHDKDRSIRRSCYVEAPYLHGVMWPQPTEDHRVSQAPWDVNFGRETLLTFVGDSVRGSATRRSQTINAMWQEAERLNPTETRSVFNLFEMHYGQDNSFYVTGQVSEFYVQAWSFYATANFSWQPRGDTPTRRAVYDSLMFGCIPVIETRAVPFYRNLYKGRLWTAWTDFDLEDVFVVIPEGKELDGPAILNMVYSIPLEEVAERRERLRSIASKLQWSAYTPDGEDALSMALMSLMS